MRWRAGLRARPRWGSSQRSPTPSSWISGPLRSGKRRGGKEIRTEGKRDVETVGKGARRESGDEEEGRMRGRKKGQSRK